MNYLLLLLFTAFCLSATALLAQETDVVSKQDAHNFLSQKPVLFQENKGQFTDVKGGQVSSVLFKTSAPGVDTYITTKGLVYVFSKSSSKKNNPQDFAAMDPLKTLESAPMAVEMEWLQMHLEGASIRPENILKELPGKTDYRFFLGHCPNGIIGIKEYEKITIREVYPGIDWVLYGSSKNGMKYDFIVHPGADANRIKLLYEGEHPLNIDEQGNIQLQMRWGKITENAPVSFSGDDRKVIRSAFKSEIVDRNNARVSYAIGEYDKQEILIIDPQLVWGTLFGGNNNDNITSITHDSNNNLFITGNASSVNFPLLNSGTYFQSAIAGIHVQAFILKFDDEGVLLWSTLYGGSVFTAASTATGANGIMCDGNNNVFVTGTTGSLDFPVQNAGTYFDGTLNGVNDAFILKFDNAGNRLWATFYGGDGSEFSSSVCCDPTGNVFITGMTGWVIPPYPPTNNFELQNAGTYFQISTGFTGLGDLFILKFDNSGNRLWATLYGGDNIDKVTSIVSDANGNVFITGSTTSLNFPVQNAGTYV